MIWFKALIGSFSGDPPICTSTRSVPEVASATSARRASAARPDASALRSASVLGVDKVRSFYCLSDDRVVQEPPNRIG